MLDYFSYFFMQLIGYRKIYFDAALARGIPLSGYSMWAFYPMWEKGTYREVSLKKPYRYAGYGVDR